MASTKREYRFGIIGLGMMSHFHAKAIRETKGARLVAVASRDAGKAAEFAAQYGVEGVGSYRALVERDDIDIVTICTASGRRGRRRQVKPRNRQEWRVLLELLRMIRAATNEERAEMLNRLERTR